MSNRWLAIVAIIAVSLCLLAGCGSRQASQVHNSLTPAVQTDVHPLDYPFVGGGTPSVPARDPFMPLVAASAAGGSNNSGSASSSGNSSDSTNSQSSIGNLQLVNVYRENGIKHATFSYQEKESDLVSGQSIDGYKLTGVDISGGSAAVSKDGQSYTLNVPQPSK